VIGAPEISTDGLHYYRPAIRGAFSKRTTHGVINKTYSVTHLNVNEASHRYPPAQVIAVERVAIEGEPLRVGDRNKSGIIAKSDGASTPVIMHRKMLQECPADKSHMSLASSNQIDCSKWAIEREGKTGNVNLS
jgi:hypothetical protein